MAAATASSTESAGVVKAASAVTCFADAAAAGLSHMAAVVAHWFGEGVGMAAFGDVGVEHEAIGVFVEGEGGDSVCRGDAVAARARRFVHGVDGDLWGVGAREESGCGRAELLGCGLEEFRRGFVVESD